jgi:hypothetical protein
VRIGENETGQKEKPVFLYDFKATVLRDEVSTPMDSILRNKEISR